MKKPLIPVFIFLLFYSITIIATTEVTQKQPKETYSIQTEEIIRHWKDSGWIQTKMIPMLSSTQRAYLSHPPLSYHFLYIFEKYTGVQSFYIFNTLLVSTSAFFIYLTISLISLKHPKKEFHLFSWIGMVLFLTSYPILKYQLFNYHPDIFVLTPLIITHYLFLKLMMKEKHRSIKYMFWIGLLFFIIDYSSWFGVVFSFIVGLIGLFNLRKGYKLILYILLAWGLAWLATAMTYSQYAMYGGWKNMAYYFKDTYLRESPIYGNLRQSSFQIFVHVMKYDGILIISLFLLIFSSFLSKSNRFLFTKNGYRYLMLSLPPVLIYSIVLLQYFQNSFVCLYFVPPLVITTTIWIEKLSKGALKRNLALKLVALIILSNLSLFIFF